jgi:hypothetical protein
LLAWLYVEIGNESPCEVVVPGSIVIPGLRVIESDSIRRLSFA